MNPTPTRYVPIVKGKRGEYTALRQLRHDVSAAVTPLIEVPFISKHKPVAPEQHLDKQAQMLGEYWGARGRVFLDLRMLPARVSLPGSATPLAYLREAAARAGAGPIVPVTPLAPAVGLRKAITEAVREDGHGACLRLGGNGTGAGGEGIDRVDRLLSALGLAPEHVDVVVDAGAFSAGDRSRQAANGIQAVRDLPHLGRWRSLWLAGSSLPGDFSAVGTCAQRMLPQAEQGIWREVAAATGDLPQALGFADYSVVHPELSDPDPRTLTVVAALRYTTTEGLLVARERSIRRYGSAQYRALCRWLLDQPQYAGARFSWGDDYIYACAHGVEGPGTPERWVSVAINHHVHHVVEWLENPR